MPMSPVAGGAASSGAAGSAVVVLVWVLSLFHIALPPDVAAALVMLLAPLVHLAVSREKDAPEEKYGMNSGVIVPTQVKETAP